MYALDLYCRFKALYILSLNLKFPWLGMVDYEALLLINVVIIVVVVSLKLIG